MPEGNRGFKVEEIKRKGKENRNLTSYDAVPLTSKMVAIRTIHYVYPIRLPLLVLFFLIVILSIVLTLISLNERLESSRLRPMAAEFPAAVSDRSSNGSGDPARDGNGGRLAKVRRLKQLKAQLLRKSGLASRRASAAGRGWKVLPGDVVVPDSEQDNPHPFAYLTNAVESCKKFFDESAPGKKVNILIFVESDAKNADRRRVIRETWALPMLQKALNFKVVFMLGAARTGAAQDIVDEEFYAYGDIVQENFTESFKHLTLKSVMGLKWTQTYCPEAEFVAKTDDDILVHVPNLIASVLPLRDSKQHLLLCRKNRSRQIVRRGHPLLKYQVSQHELPGHYFPDYCGGFFYVMSRNTVQLLYAVATRTPYFFIEDVYVTGFCRHRAGIELTDHPHIGLRPHVTPAQAFCHFAEGKITSQELEREEMRHIWQAVNTRGFFCPVPVGRNRTDE